MTIKLCNSVIRSNTILYCDTYEQTVAFYRDILSFPVSYEADYMIEFRVFDQTFLSVADSKQTSIKSSNGDGITISLKVKAIDPVCDFLNEQGITGTEIKSVWDSRVLYIFDPEGNRIEFWA